MKVLDQVKKIQSPEGAYIANKKEGKVYTSDFENGKILSVVTDGEVANEQTVYQTSRTQIKATYIKAKDQVIELKIQKFEKKAGTLQLATEIRLDTKILVTLTNFLQFLLAVDLSSVSAGKLSFEKNIELDPELDSKLRALASDEHGKGQLLKLFDEGYLTSELDIPELVKK